MTSDALPHPQPGLCGHRVVAQGPPLMDIDAIMRASPVIPVLVVDDAATARPIAEALVRGGLRVLEVTMRTPAALDAIREMSAVEGAIVGAGTVLSPGHFDAVMDAGAQFIVSPGLTETLGRVVVDSGVPFLPGVVTAGDLMRGYDLGLRHFKFFPAEASGGLKALKALAAPFHESRFCPTGGITQASAPEWLGFDPVLCVGGSWMNAGSLSEIESKARSAAALRP